jgi:hypothetical protein
MSAQIARLLFDRLRAQGVPPLAAAGLLGNLRLESGLNTGARNPGDGRDGSDSIGLAQWNSTRAAALKALAAERGVDWRDPSLQADFIARELQTTEGRAARALLAAKTPEQAGAAAIGYFRPAGFSWDNPAGGHNADKRIAAAREYAAMFDGQPAPARAAGVALPALALDPSGGQPIGAGAPLAGPSEPPPVEAPPADAGLAQALASLVEVLGRSGQPQASWRPSQAQNQPQKPRKPDVKVAFAPERGVSAPARPDMAAIFRV